MEAWITKDSTGLVQLWNNKPEYNEDADLWYAWEDRANYINECAIDVTENKFLNNIVKILERKKIEKLF